MNLNIAVIQLARLGDILQTLPTIDGLKAKYPGAQITFIARETFIDAAKLSPHITRLVEFPSNSILIPALSGNREVSFQRLSQWVHEEFYKPGLQYDLVINLTFSESSSYLSSLIPATKRLGMYRGTNDTLIIEDLWSQYFFSQVQGKNLNIIHLTDLFQRIAQVSVGRWPITLSRQNEASGSSNIVGVQIATSRTEKTLTMLEWIQICQSVLNDHPQINLRFFGGAKDKDKIDELIQGLRQECLNYDPLERITILAGSTPFHENLPLIQECKWIITPDTAMVHLASLCEKPIIYLARGPVRPEETGPYGENHHILFTDNVDSHELGRSVSLLIAGKAVEIRKIPHASTRFSRCSDRSFRNEMVPINYTPDEVFYFFSRAYYLLAEFRCGGRIEELGIPSLTQIGQTHALDNLLKTFDALCSTHKLADFGRQYCHQMFNQMSNHPKLQELMGKVLECEGLLQKLESSFPLVRPLIDTWKVAKDTSANHDLRSIIEVTEAAYRELTQNIDIVQQLLQTTVDAAQKHLSKKSAVSSLPKEHDL